MFLANSGCGKFHPTNAPTANQNNVSNMVSPYLSGNGGITGAALPPNPEITCEGSAVTGAGFQLGAGVGVYDAAPKLGVVCGAANPPAVEKPLPGACSPPLLAPPSFSCVRPNAAIPSTAPMAMWNRPAPCSVSGFHCVIGL